MSSDPSHPAESASHPDRGTELELYLLGEVTPERGAELRILVENDPAWQAELAAAQQRIERLRRVPASEASEALVQSTVARLVDPVHPFATWQRWVGRAGLVACAALLLAAIGIQLWAWSLRPTPFDLQVQWQSTLAADSPAAARIVLRDALRRTPLAGVPVEVALLDNRTQQRIELARFQTDAHGIGEPQVRLPDWPAGSYRLIVTAATSTPEVLEESLQLERPWRAMLSTDKPRYQPGQTIRIRALALRRATGKPVAAQRVELSVADPNSNTIFRRSLATSRFGIVSADCPLDRAIDAGTYRITCRVDDTISESTVIVERYVLPKFKITTTFDQPYYSPGDTLLGAVEAQYFFGQPLSGAKVELAIRGDSLPRAQSVNLTLVTDAKGKASFAYTVPQVAVGRPRDGGLAQVEVVATVVDSAGQKEQRTATRMVAAEPIQIEVIPEWPQLVARAANRLHILTSYPDGRPAPADVDLRSIVGDAVLSQARVTTNALGAAVVELTPGKTEDIEIEVAARDAAGRTARRRYAPQTANSTADFVFRTDRAVYHTGDTLSIDVRGSGIEPVFLDILAAGQSIVTATIELREGRGQYVVDLPQGVAGAVEVQGYRFIPGGTSLRKRRVVCVLPNEKLSIAMTADRPQYRPGESARVQFQLTGADGQPRPGAVSLSVIDEAVLALGNGPVGLERTFFELDEELLKPVYTIYPWSPFDRRAAPPADRATWEDALFARAAEVEVGAPGAMQRATAPPPPAPFRMRRETDWTMREAPTVETFAATGVAANDPHTLQAATFGPKQTRISALQHHGEDWATFCFGWFAMIGLITVLTLFVLQLAANWQLLVGIVIGAGLALVLAAGAIGVGSRGMFQSIAGSLPATAAAESTGDFQFAAKSEAAFFEGADPTPEKAAPRVRQDFPETLLWRPELITDDHGVATLEIPLADSITRWHIAASAVTAAGELASSEHGLTVFQPFFVDVNLPVALTRGDEVTLPIVVYNYLDAPQQVVLEVAETKGLEILSERTLTVNLAPQAVQSTSLRVKATKIGRFPLEVTATSEDVADAIRREVTIDSDGERIDLVASGSLQELARHTLDLPETAIAGSSLAVVKVYPTNFSQLVDGLENIFRAPYGCFEQTSSTTYPNVLALDYLRRENRQLPQVEAQARQYIHLGYQRLLSFEVRGGGFSYFGDSPADVPLTAYGFMEFEDLARVHDVDPQVIRRTRDWLMEQRYSDGSWSGGPHDTNDRRARLTTTAYVARSVFASKSSDYDARLTLAYFQTFRPEEIEDAYTLGLVLDALAGLETSPDRLLPYVKRLESLAMQQPGGQISWSISTRPGGTLFFSQGVSGDVETTATVVLALLHAKQGLSLVGPALDWLVAQKQPHGTWSTPRSTVAALQAILAAGEASRPSGTRTIELFVNGARYRSLTITPDQWDVVQQIEIPAEQLTPGDNTFELRSAESAMLPYQIALSHYRPIVAGPQPQGPLELVVDYDRSELATSETITASVRLRNRSATPVPMVMLDLPIPPGFALDRARLDKAVAAGRISKYEVTPRQLVIYLTEIAAGSEFTLTYGLTATMPVRVTAPPAVAYPYYEPDQKTTTAPRSFAVDAQ